jgi:hypothetical protein
MDDAEVVRIYIVQSRPALPTPQRCLHDSQHLARGSAANRLPGSRSGATAQVKLSRERQADTTAAADLVRDSSVVAAPVSGRPWKADGPRTAPWHQFSSALRPWTAQHNGLQPDKVTHHGTEKKRPASTRYRS